MVIRKFVSAGGQKNAHRSCFSLVKGSIIWLFCYHLNLVILLLPNSHVTKVTKKIFKNPQKFMERTRLVKLSNQVNKI